MAFWAGLAAELLGSAHSLETFSKSSQGLEVDWIPVRKRGKSRMPLRFSVQATRRGTCHKLQCGRCG